MTLTASREAQYRSWRWSLLQVFAGLCAWISFGAVSAAAPDPAPLNPAVKIRMNTAGLTGEGGLFLALDKGYFSAEGLQVELTTAAAANSSSDILAQLAAGELDLASFGVSAAMFNATSRGVGVVGLLPMSTIQPSDRSSGIVVRQDHIASGRYKTPKDLKGMKVAVLTLGGTGQYNVGRAAKAAGLRDGDVDFTTLSFPDAVVALANKSIDAAFEVEPFINVAATKGAGKLVIPASDTSLGAPSIVLFANARFLATNKIAVQRFLAAFLKGQRDYAAAVEKGIGRDELDKSLAAHTPMKDLARLRAMALPTVDPNGQYDRSAIEAFEDFLVANGSVAKPVPVDRLFDRSLVDAAVARIGRIGKP